MTTVFHHNDLDGRCAAAVVEYFAGDRSTIKFVECDYKDTFDFSDIEINEEIIIVDFSFTPAIMKKLGERTKDVTWIDHHKTASEYQDIYEFPVKGIRDFSGGPKSGCLLAWEYYFPRNAVPESVRMISAFDTWYDTRDPIIEFVEGMKLCDTRPESTMWVLLFDDGMSSIENIKKNGNIAIQWRKGFTKDYRKSFGYETVIYGQPAYALNLAHLGSFAFGNDFYDKYSVLIAYAHDGNKFTVSLYSKNVDVGEICKTFGGGGHTGAAGFVCEQLPFKRSN